MKGHNKVWISGNVGGKIVHSQTRDSNPACSFSLASEQEGRGATWVRVNCYGQLAIKLKDFLKRGAYLSVEGELMNRAGKFGELTEVRAKDVIPILPGKDSEGEDNYDEEWSTGTAGEEDAPM